MDHSCVMCVKGGEYLRAMLCAVCMLCECVCEGIIKEERRVFLNSLYIIILSMLT